MYTLNHPAAAADQPCGWECEYAPIVRSSHCSSRCHYSGCGSGSSHHGPCCGHRLCCLTLARTRSRPGYRPRSGPVWPIWASCRFLHTGYAGRRSEGPDQRVPVMADRGGRHSFDAWKAERCSRRLQGWRQAIADRPAVRFVSGRCPEGVGERCMKASFVA
jgi:hypothetical protein